MLHRPSSVFLGGNYIWLARSPDLSHWGDHVCIAQTREEKWDSERIGAGASPILTSAGWLELYHGADKDQRHCLGALLERKSVEWGQRESVRVDLEGCRLLYKKRNDN